MVKKEVHKTTRSMIISDRALLPCKQRKAEEKIKGKQRKRSKQHSLFVAMLYNVTCMVYHCFIGLWGSGIYNTCMIQEAKTITYCCT